MTHTILRLTQLISKLREYLSKSDAVEVITPILLDLPTSEPTISNFKVEKRNKYLRTSSEFELKKILIEKNIDVFEIGHVFRANESGSIHLEEFRMLEWYRREKSYLDLMEEISSILEFIGINYKTLCLSYKKVFDDAFDIEPHTATDSDLRDLIRKNLEVNETLLIGRGELFDCLNIVLMKTQLFKENAIFVYDFPTELRGYSELCDDPRYAKRFELYIQGIEIVNGYQEIVDSEIQELCFKEENKFRKERGFPTAALNQEFINILKENNCGPYSGAAMGIERLLAVLHQVESFNQLKIY